MLLSLGELDIAADCLDCKRTLDRFVDPEEERLDNCRQTMVDSCSRAGAEIRLTCWADTDWELLEGYYPKQGSHWGDHWGFHTGSHRRIQIAR